MKSKALWIAIIFILAAAMTRFIGLPPNVAPIGAMALFGSAYIKRGWIAFALPLAALWLSNLYMDNVVYAQYYDSFVWISKDFSFIAFALLAIVLLGKFMLKKIKIERIFISSLAASTIFFLITNLGVWLSPGMYSKDIAGLLLCFEMALPFFDNTLFGDLAFCTVMFGGYELVRRYIFSFDIKTEQAR